MIYNIRFRVKWQRFLIFLLSFLLSLTPLLKTVAQEKSPFYWDFINVEMEVQENGDMLISETQKYVFTQSHSNQRYRYIPLDKVDEITDVAVFENEKQIPAETGVENNQLWIRWKHELNPPEAHTFVLKYRVIGGLQFNEDNIRVYWKAIFPERNTRIEKSKIVVKLPQALSGNILEYTSYGVSTNIREINPYTFEFVAQQPIYPAQLIEVFIAFPQNILDIPKPNWQRFSFLKAVLDVSLFYISLFSLIFIMRGISTDGGSSAYGSGTFGGGGSGGRRGRSTGGGGGGCGGGGGGGGGGG